MLERLGRFLLRRRWAVLAATLVAVVVAGVVGGSAITRLKSGGFDDPAAESTRAAEVLRDQFGTGDPNLVLLVTAKGGDVDDPAVAAAGEAITRRLAAEPDLAQVLSYWATDAPALKSADGAQALVLGRITGDEEDLDARAAALTDAYARDDADLRVQVGGQAQVFREVGEQVEADLARAEAIAVPITLLLLVLVFASAVAGILPLAVGGFAIVGTLLVLRVLAQVTDVSIYALNLTTALGLGLAIDYSLFIVSRYREELRAGRDPGDALIVTMRTAGRTVLFSAATVAVSLLALLVFPLYFLRSFGYAGIAVVALAAVGALVVLPALLAVLGRRVDRFRLPIGRRATVREPGTGFWHRIATWVMRRPVPIALAVVAFLVLLGTPFLGVRFGLPDDRVLPPGAEGRQVADAIRGNFATDESSALSVVAPGTGDPRAHLADIDGYAAALSRLDGVERVDALTGAYTDGARLQGPLPAADAAIAPGGAALRRRQRHLAVGGAVGRALLGGRRGAGGRGPRPPGPAGRPGHRPLGPAGRHQGVAVRAAAGRRGHHRRRHLRAAVPDDRQRGHPGQGAGAEPALADRRLRGHGLGLPGRQPGRCPRVHANGYDRHVHAGAAVLHRLRALHGLRGVPAVADQGGARPHRRHGRRGRGRAGADRPHRHHRGRPAGDRVRRLRHLAGQLPQAVRDRHRPGHPGRRHPHPGPAGAGVHARGRPGQLVGAGAAAPAARPGRAGRDPRAERGLMPAARSSTPSRRARARRGEGSRLREEILAAATRLLVETGDEEAVSIRAVAEAVGVTPPSIYLHFADKTELIFAVCEEQFRQLDAEMAAAAAGAADPLEALRRRGQAYVRFGLRNAEAYRVLFMYKDHVPEDFDRETMARSETFNHLVDSVQRCLDAGVFKPGDPLQISIGLWVLVHGITSLLLAAPGFPWPAEPAELVDRLIADHLQGLLPTP